MMKINGLDAIRPTREMMIQEIQRRMLEDKTGEAIKIVITKIQEFEEDGQVKEGQDD